MAIADQDEVKFLLEDFEDRLRYIVDDAWLEWLEFPDRGRFEFVARIRAAFVFDAIVRLAKEEFAGDPNVQVMPKSQTVHFLIKGQVYIRFKKGNAHGVGSNIPTQATLDFTDPQRSLPGLLPDILKVEICYQPDDLGIRLEEIAVVARDRNRRIWAYPLAKPKSADVVLLPPRAPDERPPAVTPKRLPEKGTGTEDE